MTTRTIEREDLIRVANDFAVVLEREKISSLGELERRVEETVLAGEGKISFELRPSEHGTQAYTMGYIISGKGIPIEIRMNKHFNYVRFIVKVIDGISGYTPFFNDEYGNLIQEKLGELSWESITGELSKLATI
jgi:hypothetical protein